MFSHLLLFYFYVLFITGKEIGQMYKHGQSQLPIPSFKAPNLSSFVSQTPYYIELTTTSVSPIRDKNQNNSVLCSKKDPSRMI